MGGLQIKVSVNQRDIASISRKLGQIQGTPLALRLQEAIKTALDQLVAPLRGAAPQPGNERGLRDATGQLAASTQVWAPRKRLGEVAAYAVGPRGGRSKTKTVAPHRHLVIRGHRMVTHSGAVVGWVEGNPYVDAIVNQREGQIDAYVSAQVSRISS